ncbi:pullulanase-type alpha-1,6-glucosidase [Vibrio sp. CAU 1672]|uniref:pullulanase-type alpha-1,6-glucosidase n=1 Tax=Vibrio sp. CAU 1672 TaxID=3032594 RepID=UPI0023DAEB4B|nr:pullulanase-type alpha-1,6-glucosidase [Vibrio sp. CAU 1672]MDF2153059.1 pullulanase-type alpha-1,6-glucosidase [Vibrio sp. CAU 1672]
MDNKTFKLSTIAKTVLPLISVAVLSGCGADSTPENTNPGNSGLHPAGENEVVIYYKRDVASASTASDYDGWGLHLWNGEGCTSTDLEAMGIADGGTDWNSPRPYDGISDTYGAYYVLKVDPDASDPHECMNFILHKGDEKAFGSSNSKVELTKIGESKGLFGFHGSSELYYEPIAERPVEIDGQKAHWLDATTIAWESAANADSMKLFYSLTNDIKMDEDKNLSGGTAVELTKAGDLSEELKSRFRHLKDMKAAGIDVDDATLRTILKSQIVMVAYNANGDITSATEVQKAGVLDAVFADADAGNAIGQELGALVEGGAATFKLWAPTAQDVDLIIYDAELNEEATVAMTEDPVTGIWASEAQSDVVNKFYRYQVKVYHPITGVVETRLVTDPYSLSLSENSRYSQVVDLDDPSLMPQGWNEYERPTLTKDEDHVLYESHLRDFSFSDSKGTPAYNGKYLALTEADRESVTHLQALKDAGLTTLHVLPAFDIATVDENADNQVNINDTVGKLCGIKPEAAVCETEDDSKVIEDVLDSYDPSTGAAQALMNDLRMLDSFNWGYDPFHYTVPEGSYATDANGSKRILEFREMVQATHKMDLKLVMDVVYNHTNASGVNDKSVLDKIVPGYYHRLNVNTGGVERSTCCDNTATENLMMGKLMVDSLKVWADDYKVDGFRFDLMGHQPKDVMVYALEQIRKIDPNTLFYGEGWDFGEVSNNARFDQSTQINMAGTEIGTFSDRLRDAVRGGSPFDGGTDSEGNHPLRFNQGFANAAYPNEETKTDADSVNGRLHNQDLVRLGMAGNLADYILLDYKGETKLGKNVDYNGAPAGYTKFPSENISYVSKHDNQTLWDNNAYKIATGTDSAERARMQSVSLSTVMLGQGIPFIHMGSELLRSKSMQRDSYDSGDWYNRVFFDGSDNNWNVGLPREDKDGANWDLIKQIIGDSSAMPSAADIELTKQQFLELLKIRSSSELFRLDTAEEVMNRVDFRNVGADQKEGLIVMSIDDGTSAGKDLDPNYDAIVAIVNASAEEQSFTVKGATGFELHAVQQASADTIVKTASFSGETFTVPALTTAVFVQPQAGAQGAGLPVNTDNKDVSSIPPYGETAVYVKGSMNGWSDNADWAMTFIGNGIYSVTGVLEAGDHEFKFADAAWSNPNIGCDWAVQADDSLALGAEGNCKLTVAETGKYTFTLNALYVQDDSVEKPVVSVTKSADAATFGETALYLRGDVTDASWGALETAKFSYVANDVYALDVDLKAGSFQMKVADANWTGGTNFGGTGSVTLGEPITMAEGSNDNLQITLAEDGNYHFDFNAADKAAPVLTVTKN